MKDTLASLQNLVTMGSIGFMLGDGAKIKYKKNCIICILSRKMVAFASIRK